MTPETPIAVLDTTDVKVELVGAPDLETRYGQPFIAEKAYVWTDHRLGVIFTSVSGRAIKANSEIGKAIRHRGFDLVAPPGHRGYDPPAPSWLVEALKAAGITW